MAWTTEAKETGGHAEGSSSRASHASAATTVGNLCANLPDYVVRPPIEAVCFAWGVAEDGQLGMDTQEDVLVPRVVEALLGTQFRGREFDKYPIVAGSRNTLAIDSDGQVLSWGWNARCTLGQGHGRTTVRKPRRIEALSGVRTVQLTIGGWHALSVSEDGQAYAWGGNEYGQCGVCLEQRDVPTPMPCVPHLRVTQVAAGGMHSCVLTDAGEVWTWGEPWGDFSMNVNRAPQRVEGASGIAKIVCGAFHNLALTREGEVLAWGINDYGQLGNGTTFYETRPSQVVGLEHVSVSDIAAGGWHSLAITTEGEVYVWGRGEYGRLGLGDRNGSSKLRATRVSGLDRHCVVQAACGGTHTTVLTAEGRLLTWGRASFGRLGTNSQHDCYSPVEVMLPGGPERWRVIAISCGGRHSLCLALPDKEGSAARPPRPASLPNLHTGLNHQEPARGVSSPRLPHAPASQGVLRSPDEDSRPTVRRFVDRDEDEDGDSDGGARERQAQPQGSSPHDLVSTILRQEAEEDARIAEDTLPPPGSAEDFVLEDAEASPEGVSPGGESPSDTAPRHSLSQAQLATRLSAHALREDEEAMDE